MALLTACGGGGGGDAAAPASPPASSAAPAAVPVSIVTQPVDRSVVAGGSAVFGVAATGDGAAYQWQRSTDGGVTWSAISGASGASLTLAAVDAALTGSQYRVVVTGAANSVTSSAVTLTVTPAVIAPSITVNVASQTVTSGGGAAFTVTAAGSSLAYQWQGTTGGAATFVDIAGATTATLTLTGVTVADSGRQFRVTVSNSAGSVISASGLLTVTAAPTVPLIVSVSAGATVTAPAPATFSVVAAGNPAPTYRWQRSNDNGATYVDVGSTASYTTGATALSDDGSLFRVVVSNAAGSTTSAVARLTVSAATAPPSITTPPADVTVTQPAAATFSVVAAGSPTPTYQWQVSTDRGTTFINVNGATAASYTTPATTAADADKLYRVVVSNSRGSVTSAAVYLTVNPPAPTSFPAAIAGDPAFTSSCANTPSKAVIGPFATQSGDCFVTYQISDAELAAYQANYNTAAVRSKVLEAVRSNFKDRVDAVIVVLDVDSVPSGTSLTSVNFSVQSCSVHNPACPRFGRLGNVWLPLRDYLRNGPSLHELLHGFTSRMAADGTTNFIIPTVNADHWGFSSVGGQLGGWDRASFVSLGGGTYQARAPLRPAGYAQPTTFGLFANGGNTIPYGNLELWTMGLIPDAELQSVDVAENAAFTSTGTFTATAIHTYAPADIIARTLPAGRPLTTTPRAFRGLVVLATTRNAGAIDAATVAQLNTDIEQFSMRSPTTAWSRLYNFWTATGARASIHLATASELAR